jgi:GNAT superfamily N-acetyltransferase
METENITIRQVSIQEAQLLSDLAALAFSQAFARYNTPEDLAAYLAEAFSPDKQAEELARPGSTFLIVEVDGTLAGYAHLQENQAPQCVTGNIPVELVRFYLLDAWIGKGIGSRLMQESIEEARRKGADVLWLGVWEKNTRAIAFYKKWDFKVVGSHNFQLGSDLQQDLLMQRVV